MWLPHKIIENNSPRQFSDFVYFSHHLVNNIYTFGTWKYHIKNQHMWLPHKIIESKPLRQFSEFVYFSHLQNNKYAHMVLENIIFGISILVYLWHLWKLISITCVHTFILNWLQYLIKKSAQTHTQTHKHTHKHRVLII